MFLLLCVFLLSIVSTFFIKCYAQKNLLDIPNQRSSHSIATPKGGGLAIVLSFCFAILTLFFYKQINLNYFQVFNLSILVAGIGLWDDHQHIPARWRFLVHVLVASVGLYLLNGFPMQAFSEVKIDLGLIGFFFAIAVLVWLLNLFNFMDGIDGLAASEAIFVSSALAFFLYNMNNQLAIVALVLAASSLGFLLWNWPVAKIFMGDVGSGFLGITLGFLIIMASHQSSVLLLIGIILSAVFVTDATYTLLRRFFTGQKWYDAHCSHAYQNAARQYGHLRVLQLVWGINLFWLLPIAYCAYLFPFISAIAIIMAYLPLLFLAIRFNAGRQECI